MSLIINHNISALNTQRQLKLTSKHFSKSLEKLSSGYKINVASDDPSGLIISEQLRSQTNGLQRAIRNSQEASNVIGIAEGALIEMNEILRKLRALALHAANNGVTAPDQIRADQAEVDSAIQTIDRIANTTRYSDQFLLNGSKGLVYDRITTIDDPMDHALLDTQATRIDQVFKREGVSMTVAFTGIVDDTQADHTREAMRAYMEADSANVAAEFDAAGVAVSGRQEFILTGTSGSRLFSFDAGTQLGTMVSGINNVKESTGVGATLIFGSQVDPDEMVEDWNATRTAGDVEIYGAALDDAAGGNDKVNGLSLTGGGAAPADYLRVGKNTDGHGRMYAKVTDITGNVVSYDLYKDADCTMLLGSGTHDSGGPAYSFTAASNSEIPADAIELAIDTTGNAAADDVYTISVIGLEMDNTEAGIETDNMNMAGFTAGTSSVVTGLKLGENTDAAGRLYFEATGADTSRTINVYKGSEMTPDQLVSQGTADLSGGGSIRLEAQNESELNITLTFGGACADDVKETSQLSFTDLGVRLYSEDYGSQEYLRVQNNDGQLFHYYRLGDTTERTMLEEKATTQVVGQDAQISLNGQPLGTDGLTANVTTPDFSGSLVFNEGELGLTRIAQVGYDVGALYSRATALQAVVEDETVGTTDELGEIFTFATNARKATTEDLTNFIGGMQYQLGAGEGDQERTVYGIQSMASVNMGRIEIDGRVYTLQDVLAGGDASLMNDSITALRVVTAAVNDVSELRARLGAFQKNMLQTNINSLNVTVENIVKTESAIRDANMANETTEFTKNQILLQAGTAMLAQANTASQNILQLLG